MDAIAERVAGTYLPVPYRLHGEGLDGWDCRGCVKFGRADLFGLGWASDDIYDARDAADRCRVAALLEGARPFWRRLERPAPGAVVVLQHFGSPGHVGLMISRHGFVHCRARKGTTVGDIRDTRFRVEGFYDD